MFLTCEQASVFLSGFLSIPLLPPLISSPSSVMLGFLTLQLVLLSFSLYLNSPLTKPSPPLHTLSLLISGTTYLQSCLLLIPHLNSFMFSILLKPSLHLSLALLFL